MSNPEKNYTMFKKIAFLFFASTGLSLYSQTTSLSLTITGDADANVISNSPGSNNFGATSLPLSRNGGGVVERSLLKFDLRQIPPGVDIISASLKLYGISHTLTTNEGAKLQMVKNTWSQSNLNWSFSTSEIDINQPVASLSAPANALQNYQVDVKDMVQTMVNTPLINYGWMLYLNNESSVTAGFKFASGNHANLAMRPTLEIIYCEHMNLSAYVSPAKNETTTNGAASVLVWGGVPPYTYLWSNSATTSEINNIASGTYEVVVTDSRGVFGKYKVPVTQDCGEMVLAPSGGGTFSNARVASSQGNNNYGNSNYQANDYLEASVTGSGTNKIITRNVLSFDLNTLPSNVQVTGATLVLTDAAPTQDTFKVRLHRLTEPWNSRTVTFNNQPAGGENIDDIIELKYTGSQATYEIDVTAHIQKMISEGNSKQGWALELENEETGASGRLAKFVGPGGPAVQIPFITIQLTMPNYACDDLLLNWNEENSYDANGNVVHTEKTYLDKLGRRTQALVRNATNEVYRNETLYDAYGRPAIRSLPAYTGNHLEFEIGFMRNYQGFTYKYQHYDAYFNKQNSPDALHVGVNNTLGNYYSDQNVYDAYQAKADNPYTRIVYSGDPYNLVRKTAQPGNAFKMGSGRESTVISMVSGNELKYFYNGLSTTNSYKAKQQSADKMNCDQIQITHDLYVTKEITVTPDNAEVIVYKEGGKVLVTCYSNLSASERCSNITGVQNLMQYKGTASTDIHLPDADKASLKLPLPINNSNPTTVYDIAYTIIDLMTENVLTETVDFTINANREVVFSSAFLNLYPNRSLFLRISFAYDGGYAASFGSNTPADALVIYNLSYGHITRNSYDLAGNLRKTVSPKAFDCSAVNNFDFYNMYSTYDYSHLGQMIASKSPEVGLVQMVYDKKGNPRFKQNDKQKALEMFSYVNYDKHGRVVETGESQYANVSGSSYFENYYGQTTVSQIYANTNSTDVIINQSDGLLTQYKSDKTEISFVAPVANSANDIPSAYTFKSQYDKFRNGQTTWIRNANSTVWMNHDKFDRSLATIVQITEADFVSHRPNINDRIKTTEFTYDYYTGKTTSSTYQQNNTDEKLKFQHNYDANQRTTSTDLTFGGNTIPETLNQNYYSKSGKVKRQVIGGGLQGIDYTYTIDGKLKAINHPSLASAADPGADQGAYADVFGEIIEYFPGDYERTGKPFNSSLSATNVEYNGMIHSIRFRTKCMSGGVDVASYIDYGGANINVIANASQELKFEYQYDDLNRLAHSSFMVYNSSSGVSTGYTRFGEHGASGGPITYDKNGNITRLTREAHSATLDNLTYTYHNGTTSNYNNKLTGVTDAATAYNNPLTNFYTSGVQATYQYNAIGQLTSASSDNISNITYFPDGKVKKITFISGATTEYEYGADGSKIKSECYNPTPSPKTRYTWYIGPFTYEYDQNATTPAFNIKHAAVPGGIIRVAGGTDITTGYLVYQLTDHQGNVRVTFKKNTANNGIDMLSWQDYYAFGGRIPGRTWILEKYDHAFLGSEQSNDNTRWDHFPLREFDHDLGRWMTPDPYKQFLNPYVALGNNPVNYSDPSGGYVINMPMTSAENYRRKHYIDPGLWKEYVDALRDPLNGIVGITHAESRYRMQQKSFEGYMLYRALRYQEEEERQRKEDEFFDEIAERYSQASGHKTATKGYWANGHYYYTSTKIVTAITRAEAKQRWYDLNEASAPVVTPRPNMDESEAAMGYDINASMARNSAFLVGVQAQDALNKAVAEIELNEVLAEMGISREAEDEEVEAQADEQPLAAQTGNDASLTASAGKNLIPSSGANEIYGSLTIVSNVNGGTSSSSGHAWLKLIPVNGVEITLSLWDNKGDGAEDLILNRERNLSEYFKEEVSRTANLTKAQFNTVISMASSNREWLMGFTCAGFSAFIWNTVTGESLNAHESFYGKDITTPRRLQSSIITWNKYYPRTQIKQVTD